MQTIIPVRSTGPTTGFIYASHSEELPNGTKVVIETNFGMELAEVLPYKVNKENIDSTTFPPILRIASDNDIYDAKRNARDAEIALDFCKGTVKRLNLEMQLLLSYYSLNRAKLLFIYTADERVDFRELLKEVSANFRTRIELRQIGTRDRSQYIGGYASCGMSLCCHTFIDDFEGVSINMAKNQMLALNVQKLSGHCNKLLCCLKYEDDYYTEVRESLPKIGVKLQYQDNEYRLTNYNVISETARLDGDDTYLIVDFDTLRKIAK